MTVEQAVREFHRKYGHLVTDGATTNVPSQVKKLRMDLIEEEFKELKSALDEDNLIEIADACADLVYVIVGTCISYGIPFDRVFQEVHSSNMTKTPVKAVNGQKYGTATPKGLFFIAPHLRRILFEPDLKTELESQ